MSSILTETYTLNNGITIPKIALGTWLMKPEVAKEATTNALKLGYRHIDTAQAYENEVAVGEAVNLSGIDRNDIFVTSKVRAEHKDFESAYQSIVDSIARMGFEYLDMIIIHAPQPWAEFRGPNRYFDENKEVWKALERAYEEEKVRAIGVSNFLNDDMENILADCKIKPMVNQVLAHVTNTPFDVIDFCQERDIRIEAYSPIGHGAILQSQPLVDMAAKYNVSVAQLCIRYVLQLGTIALPKASSIEHLKANADVNFIISPEDMEALKNLPPIKTYGKDNIFPVFGKTI